MKENKKRYREATSMNRYKIDIYYDADCKRYMHTQFSNAERLEEAKPNSRYYDHFKVEEDTELEKPVLFHASVTRKWEDGHGCDHSDYLRTVYVLASSYFEATKLIKEKVENSYLKDDYIERVYKDEREALEILLSM